MSGRTLAAIIGIGVALAPPPLWSATNVLTGPAAFGDWHQDAPGVSRKITAADLPAPFATPSVRETAHIVSEPSGAVPKVPPGFTVTRVADHLEHPRAMTVAPNGDVFVAESRADKIVVLRDGQVSTFAAGLDSPYGIAFYPPGPDPKFVYVGNTQSIVRFPYKNGDLQANGAPETLVGPLSDSGSGHWTRDIAFSPDGKRMFVAVGSSSNDAENMPKSPPDPAWDTEYGLGAGWAHETNRADVLEFSPEGGKGKVYAAGLRNCAGLAVDPASGDPWCAVNERDGLGDNLPPDYVTRVEAGHFYGWPWYYIGGHEDPRHKGERPDLAGKVTVPDVLIQPHSAPLGIAFYDGTAFPAKYRGNAFVTLHGSWNRHQRTGYKVVRIVPGSGAYDDFLTGLSPGTAACGAGRLGSRWRRTAAFWSARTATARSGASPIPVVTRRARRPGSRQTRAGGCRRGPRPHRRPRARSLRSRPGRRRRPCRCAPSPDGSPARSPAAPQARLQSPGSTN